LKQGKQKRAQGAVVENRGFALSTTLFEWDVWVKQIICPIKICESHPIEATIYKQIPSLKLTFSHLKMDGWNTHFFLGWPIFRGEPFVSGSVDGHQVPRVNQFELLGRAFTASKVTMTSTLSTVISNLKPPLWEKQKKFSCLGQLV